MWPAAVGLKLARRKRAICPLLLSERQEGTRAVPLHPGARLIGLFAGALESHVPESLLLKRTIAT
jgi:hypothetical protein